MLPTAEEVAPWIESIIKLWDDEELFTEHHHRALHEARRWSPEIVGEDYAQCFTALAKHGTKSTPLSGDDPVTFSEKIHALADQFPWPGQKPREVSGESPGWLGEGTDQLLARVLSSETRLVVELGAWLGRSTRFIADHAPNAVVVSIDHWQGSPEHRISSEWRDMLPTLYETFLSLCWPYRERIVPLRMTTLEGLRMVGQFALAPDLIFVDAEHSLAAVSAELGRVKH